MMDADRFWARVHRGDVSVCWPWLGCRRGDGYGAAHSDGRQYGAHRVAYTLTLGPIPRGMLVCHRCDNPVCCNPGHLWIGSPGDNMRDMVAKGRHARKGPHNPARGDRNGSRTQPHRLVRGVAHPSSKLTESEVRDIRDRVRCGEHKAALAREYGVAPLSIQRLVAGVTWKHIAMEVAS